MARDKSRLLAVAKSNAQSHLLEQLQSGKIERHSEAYKEQCEVIDMLSDLIIRESDKWDSNN